MRVAIEAVLLQGRLIEYRLKLLDGYRAGEFVRRNGSETPLSDVDKTRLAAWARETGYEVLEWWPGNHGDQEWGTPPLV